MNIDRPALGLKFQDFLESISSTKQFSLNYRIDFTQIYSSMDEKMGYFII